jgi:hypothetical protein
MNETFVFIIAYFMRYYIFSNIKFCIIIIGVYFFMKIRGVEIQCLHRKELLKF